MVLALVIEVITNLFKNYIPAIKSKGYVPLIAGILGAGLCLLTSTGIITATGIEIAWPWVDYVITGIVISRGAGVVNDLAKKLAK
jgi:hypothetical protein